MYISEQYITELFSKEDRAKGQIEALNAAIAGYNEEIKWARKRGNNDKVKSIQLKIKGLKQKINNLRVK